MSDAAVKPIDRSPLRKVVVGLFLVLRKLLQPALLLAVLVGAYCVMGGRALAGALRCRPAAAVASHFVLSVSPICALCRSVCRRMRICVICVVVLCRL